MTALPYFNASGRDGTSGLWGQVLRSIEKPEFFTEQMHPDAFFLGSLETLG